MPSKIPNLTVLSGSLTGNRYDLEMAVDEILVGSDPGCQFCLDVPGVSPIHARIWIDMEGVTVHDTHSPAGVFVNDDRVVGKAPLKNGDVLWLGPPGEESSVMIQCDLPPREDLHPTVPRFGVEPEKPPPPLTEAAPAFEVNETPAPPQPAGEFELAPPEPAPGFTGAEAPVEAVFELAEGEPVGAPAVAEPVLELQTEPQVEPPDLEVGPSPEMEVVEASFAPEGTFEVAGGGDFFLAEAGTPTAEAPLEATAAPAAFEIMAPEPPAPAVPAVEPAADELFFEEVGAQTPIRADETAPAAAVEEAAFFTEEAVPPPPPEAAPTAPAAPGQDSEPQFDELYVEEPPVGAPPSRPAAATPSPLPRPSAPPPTKPAPAPRVAAEPAPTAAAAMPPASTREEPSRKPAAAAVRAPAPRTARPTPAPVPAPVPSPPARVGAGSRIGLYAGIGAGILVLALGAGWQLTRPAPPPPAPPPATTLPASEPVEPESPAPLGGPTTPEASPEPAPEASIAAPPAPAPTLPAKPVAATSPPVATAGPRQQAAAPRPTPAAGGKPALAPSPPPQVPPEAVRAQQLAAQVASLLVQAEGAMSAQKYDQAAALYEEALKLEPQNAKAVTGKAAAQSAAAVAKKAFVASRSVFLGKPKKGPAGFDDNEPADPDYQGRVEFEFSPASARVGETVTTRVFLANQGKKTIKVNAVNVTTILNGARSSEAATPQAREIAAGQRVLLAQLPTSWKEGTSTWAMEVVVTSARSESYSNRVVWK